MTKQELDTIIEKHQHWLKEDCEGWEGMKADLSMQCFYGANFYGADFYGANFYGANFKGANCEGANFKGASLDDSEKHRLGTILTKPMTGYKKNQRGCGDNGRDSSGCYCVLYQRQQVPHEQGEDYGYVRQGTAAQPAR